MPQNPLLRCVLSKKILFGFPNGSQLIFPQDIEAQSNAAALHAHGVQPSDSDYANVGRGGAGNFIKKENQSRSRMAPSSVAPLMRESAAPEMGFSGRGGAGNLRNGEIERQRLENENRAKEAREKSHAEVVRDVEMGLRMPERAHLGIQKVE